MKQKSQNLLTALGLILGVSLSLSLFFVAPKIKANIDPQPNEINIAGFESGSENWQGTGSLETDHVKQGKNSLKLTSHGFNWDANSLTAVNLDLSSLEKANLEMAISVYIDDPSQISGVRLDLGDDNSNFFYATQQSANSYQKGWNEIRFKSDQFSSQYSPTGWSQIKWLRVNLAAQNNNSEVSAWFDDWKLTNTPSPTISPAVQGVATIATPGTNQAKEPVMFINKLINGGLMLNTLSWGIASIILAGLGFWLVLKFWSKRKALSDSTNSRVERPSPFTNFSLVFLKQDIRPKNFWVLTATSFILAMVISWMWFASQDSPKPAVASIKPTVAGVVASPQPLTPITSSKWQYKVITFTIPKELDQIEVQLNALGADDWEVVSQSVSSTGKTSEYNQTYTLKKILQ